MTIMIGFALCDGCFLFTSRARRRAAVTAGACSLQSRFRHVHYLFSDSVSLLLVHITWLTDGKLRLYHAGAKQPLGARFPAATRNVQETFVIFI